ncbi:MAG TPA: hypothetical protein VFB72_14715 [Verrucomicrobiae bacterium]|nr:hypothetical protein [Verrucomicrobiae bacterium]
MALSLSKTSHAESEWTMESAASGLSNWPGYGMALAATSILIGIIWDISWHMSIGRDTFWTPAHMAIYFGGALAGSIGGWLALKYTFFSTPEERAASVNIFGARAPLGAWVAIWGAMAMLTSAPFDDWWHNAYGLDVKIISPPHTLLGLGMLAVSIGALLLTLARQNREANGVGSGLFIYVGAIFLTFGTVFITEFAYPNMQHGYACYKWCAWMIPIRLVTMGRAARISWPATRVAAVYMMLQCLMVWILPLFPAQPKLAPIFTPVTHMVPPLFPLLLVVPAFGIDLFLRNMGDDFRWWRIDRAIIVAAIFLSLLLATQWFFSEFMLSPHAENWFFAGNRNWSYGTWPGEWHKEFWDMNPSAWDNQILTPVRLLKCWLFASLMSWIALLWGSWMRKVKR